jgi:quercetin dioxygenase-like cupin family protein
VNDVTGETITFVTTAAETNGAYCVIDVEVAPGGGVPMAHVHPYQIETFEVLDGELSMKAGGTRVLARPGDVVEVRAGQVHKFWNASDATVRFRCTVAPALQFERFIETMFALAAEGRLNRRGLPSPLQLAAIANAHFADAQAPYIPSAVQKMGLVVGATLARALGYATRYDAAPLAAAV